MAGFVVPGVEDFEQLVGGEGSGSDADDEVDVFAEVDFFVEVCDVVDEAGRARTGAMGVGVCVVVVVVLAT